MEYKFGILFKLQKRTFSIFYLEVHCWTLSWEIPLNCFIAYPTKFTKQYTFYFSYIQQRGPHASKPKRLDAMQYYLVGAMNGYDLTCKPHTLNKKGRLYIFYNSFFHQI